MEERIMRKKSIIEKINSFGTTEGFKNFFGYMKNVDEEFKSVGFTGKEDNLFQEFIQAKKASFERLKNARLIIENKKREIISKLDSLEVSKESNLKIKELRDEFNHAGSCSKDINNELYELLQKSISSYYNKKKEMENEVAIKKESLIRELNKILGEEYLYKKKDRIATIKAEWKTLGYPGEQNNNLYAAYSEVTKAIYEKQKRDWEECLREKEEKEKQELEVQTIKEGIISEMRELLFVEEPTKQHIVAAKELKDRFYNSGFASKNVNELLTANFKALQSEFYVNLDRYRCQKLRDVIDNMREKIKEYEQKISRCEEKSSEYQYKIYDLDPDSKYYFENKERYESYIESYDSSASRYREYINRYNEKNR